MNETLCPADRMLRKQVLLCGAILSILGLGGIRYLASYLDGLTTLQLTNPQLVAEKYAQLLLFFAAGDALLTCSVGVVLIYFSGKVLRSGQFPPPGMRVILDTRLRTGRAARLVALVGITLAVAVVVAGLWLSTRMVWVWRGHGLRYLPGPIQMVMLQTSEGKTIETISRRNLKLDTSIETGSPIWRCGQDDSV